MDRAANWLASARLFHDGRAKVLEDPPGWLLGRARLVAWLLLVAGIFGFASVGAANATRPYLLRGPVTSANTQASLLVSPRTGSKSTPHSVCVLVSTDITGQPAELPGASSLGGSTALVFVVSPPASKPLPLSTNTAALSMAWYTTAGTYIAGATVPPCPTRSRTCPSYGPLRPYTFVVEARAGKLGGLGIGPGSTIAIGGTCS
jgi:uncharacterized membrane protein (UPF0127 family)